MRLAAIADHLMTRLDTLHCIGEEFEADWIDRQSLTAMIVQFPKAEELSTTKRIIE